MHWPSSIRPALGELILGWGWEKLVGELKGGIFRDEGRGGQSRKWIRPGRLILGQILTPIPGPSSVTWAAQICTHKIMDTGPSSLKRLAGVAAQSKGNKVSLLQVVPKPAPNLHWIQHGPISLSVLMQVRIVTSKWFFPHLEGKIVFKGNITCTSKMYAGNLMFRSSFASTKKN